MKHSRAGWTSFLAVCLTLTNPAAVRAAPEGYADDTRGQAVVDSLGECVKTQRWSKDVPCREAPAPKAPPPVAEKITLSGAVLFDFDKASLRPEGRSELARAVAQVKEKLAAYTLEQRQVTVTGHTDSVGSEAYNQTLSERRAQTVAEFMVDEGVDPRIIRARGAGESEPVASNASEQGRQENRRVEIRYQALAQPKG
jgi:OOP family OmpA-OmpF porin